MSLQQLILDLAQNEGIWPPYRLVVGDGQGGEVAFDVTIGLKMPESVEGEQCEIEMSWWEPVDHEWDEIGGEG